jgi:ABC-type nitrate/sulfonate/bicarbonate transport system substrate-binding protein
VELIMDWTPWVLDIPIDVAQEQGFFAQAGLAVRQTLPAGPTDVVKFVSTGRSQFGLYYAPDVLMGIEAGAPLLSVGCLMGHAPLGLAARPGLQLTEPKDLVGKVVAVPMIPSVRASYRALLAAGGVDPAAVQLVDPGFNLVQPILTGTYDAAAFTAFGERVEAQALGGELAYLDFRRWGSPDYAFLNVITQREFAAEHPETVRAFVAAVLRGLEFAAAHPEQAVDLYVARHPELDPKLLLPQWQAAVTSMATAGDGRPAGWQDGAAWDALGAWMVEAGLLERAPATAAAWSNDYLPRP